MWWSRTATSSATASTSQLSRYPSLFVIARNSCFTYKGRAAVDDVLGDAVGEELLLGVALETNTLPASARVSMRAAMLTPSPWRSSPSTYPMAAPQQVVGRAGDLYLAHYLLGHNMGGNLSSVVRRVVYLRLKSDAHVDRWREYVQDKLPRIRASPDGVVSVGAPRGSGMVSINPGAELGHNSPTLMHNWLKLYDLHSHRREKPRCRVGVPINPNWVTGGGSAQRGHVSALPQ
jgi:hypothetical protein